MTSRPSIRKKPSSFDSSDVDRNRYDSETQEEQSQSTSNLFNRVTNSVSGLFSNVTWSDWLKSPARANNEQDTGESSREEASFSASTSFQGNESDQIYPEEGVIDLNISREDRSNPNDSEAYNEKSYNPVHVEFSSFKRGLSVVPPTPTTSSTNVARKKGIEEFISESVIPNPCGYELEEVLTPSKKNSFKMAAKPFSEPRPSGHVFQPNGSMARFTSIRKRVRDAVDESYGEEERSAKRERPPDTPQIFTEHMVPASEPQQRKRPRFSISSFGSPLYGKASAAEEEEPSFSIFYPGRITYGGAANHQRRGRRFISKKICPRTPVVASSIADDSSDGGLSSAARRILNCIDKISTPLSDSKRIFPFTNSPRDFSFDSSYVADFHRHRPTVKLGTESNTPPVNKLLTPAKAKISKNIYGIFTPVPSKSNETIEESGHEVSVTAPAVSLPTIVVTQEKEKSSFEIKMTETPSFPTPLSILTSVNQKSSAASSFSSNGNLESKTCEPKTSQSSVEKQINTPVDENPTIQEFSYSFSIPEVVSDGIEDDSVTVKEIEFKFSTPYCEEDALYMSTSIPTEFPAGSWGDKFQLSGNMWDCNVCLLQNESCRDKCVACETPKPQTSFSSPEVSNPLQSASFSTFNSTAGWGDAFQSAKGMWDCEVCLLQNKDTASSCVACLSSRPEKKSATADKELVKPSVVETSCPSTTLPSANWGSLFEKPEGLWDCEMCLIQNKSHDSKCVACETPKPSSTSSSKPPAELSLFQDTCTKKSWKCCSCNHENSGSASNCINCMGTKSVIQQSSKIDESLKETPGFNLLPPSCNFKDPSQGFLESKGATDGHKLEEDTWICAECMLTNKQGEDKCSGCKCSKASLISDSPRSSRNSFGNSFSSDLFKTKDDWECETCLVRNNMSSQKCISCDTPKPPLNPSTIVSQAMTGNFKFGASPKPQKQFFSTTATTTTTTAAAVTTSTSTFFSIPASTANTAPSGIVPQTSETPLFKPSSSQSFIWNSPPSSTGVVSSQNNTLGSSNPTSTFSFFKVPSESIDQKSVEKPEVPATTSSDTKSTTTPLFQFGSSSVQKPETKLEFPKFDSSSTTFFKTNTAVDPVPKVNPSTFNFFGNGKKTSPLAPFTAPDLKKSPENLNASSVIPPTVPASTTPSSTFAFGQHNTKPLSTGFNFGEAATKTASNPSFSFSSGPSFFQFGQSQPTSATANKPVEPVAPSFLNIETPKTSGPFNPVSSGVSQRRIIRKALRRNK